MKACRALTWSMALFAVLLPFAPAGAGTTGTLRGHITDSVSHAPLAGVTVSVASPSQTANTTSNAAGPFSFISLAPRHVHRKPLEAGLQFVDSYGITIRPIRRRRWRSISSRRCAPSTGTVRARTTTDVVRAGRRAGRFLHQLRDAARGDRGRRTGRRGRGYSGLATVPGTYILQGQQGWRSN